MSISTVQAVKQNSDTTQQSDEIAVADQILQASAEHHHIDTTIDTKPTAPSLDLKEMGLSDFMELVHVARQIRDDAEIQEVRVKQTELNAKVEAIVADIVAEHDSVLPAAQLKILEVQGISREIFEQARSSLALGEAQTLARGRVAERFGLPPSAGRKSIAVEKSIGESCKSALEQLDQSLEMIRLASARGEFEELFISEDGLINCNNRGRTNIELNLRELPPEYHKRSAKVPLSTSLWEKFCSLFQREKEEPDNGRSKALNEVLNRLSDVSPAFRSFQDNLPKEVQIAEVSGLTKGVNTLVAEEDLNWPGLASLKIKFKLKGYSEGE